MIKFLIGYFVVMMLYVIWLIWLIWEIKRTPISPDDGTDEVDYDEFVKDMKIEQDMYLNNKEQKNDRSNKISKRTQ